MHWLRENGLYSGEWEENEGKRAKRVEQILAFTQRTFDPIKLSTGERQPISLKLGKFFWCVQRHFGSTGITTKLTDLRKFDPVEMTAPKVTVKVPAKFMTWFLLPIPFLTRVILPSWDRETPQVNPTPWL